MRRVSESVDHAREPRVVQGRHDERRHVLQSCVFWHGGVRVSGGDTERELLRLSVCLGGGGARGASDDETYQAPPCRSAA
jgi:hypothetical protein